MEEEQIGGGGGVGMRTEDGERREGKQRLRCKINTFFKKRCFSAQTHRNPIDANKARNSHGTLKKEGREMCETIQSMSVGFNTFADGIR